MESYNSSESSFHSWVLLSIRCLSYILSYFHRISLAVIAPGLMDSLGMGAEGLGLLGGIFSYTFGFAQIPLGPALDRIGPRTIIGYLMLVSTFGSFLFAISSSFPLALLGRGLIGLGMASALMGSLKALTLWFKPTQFVALSGIIISS